ILSEVNKKVGGAAPCRYSYVVFKRQAPVAFLPKERLSETLYGFLLLIVTEGHLFVFSRRTKTISDILEAFATPLEHEDLLAGSFDENTDVRRVRSSPFGSGITGCKTRHFEGLGLQKALGSLSNNRNLLKAVAGKNGARLVSLLLGESKITEYNKKVDLAGLRKWAKEKKDRLLLGGGENSFINSFARTCKAEEAGT